MMLKTFFDDIVSKSSLDFDSQELLDIKSGVEELLYRYVQQIEERNPFFKISRIQSCGSVTEKSSVWKVHHKHVGSSTSPYLNYIEMDYLAVLKKPTDCCFKRICQGCMKLESDIIGWNIGEDLANRNGLMDENNTWKICRLTGPHVFDKLFHNELCFSISSMCDCFTIGESTKSSFSTRRNGYTFHPRLGNQSTKCDKCTAFRQTGFIHIAPYIETNYDSSEEPEKCSFVLLWTSLAKTLQAPDIVSMKRTNPIKQLPVYIDFLPVFEVEKEEPGKLPQDDLKSCFIVPKMCQSALHPFDRFIDSTSWRISYNLLEADTILNTISTDHRKSYKVIKYLTQLLCILYKNRLQLNTYIAKTAFLNHISECSDVKDYTTCVMEILQNLISNYSKGVLETFTTRVNILNIHGWYTTEKSSLTAMLEALTKLMSAPSSQYSSEECSKILNIALQSLVAYKPIT